MTEYQRDGTPKRNSLLQALEIDAVQLLRNRKRTGAGMKDRLNARAYLLRQGWSLADVNEAAEDKEV